VKRIGRGIALERQGRLEWICEVARAVRMPHRAVDTGGVKDDPRASRVVPCSA
jgi:hypothetical protein